MMHFHNAQRCLLTILADEQNYLAALHRQSRGLLKITNASGVAALVDGKFSGEGIIPDDAALDRLADWLAEDESRDVLQAVILNRCCHGHDLSAELRVASCMYASRPCSDDIYCGSDRRLCRQCNGLVSRQSKRPRTLSSHLVHRSIDGRRSCTEEASLGRRWRLNLRLTSDQR
jgi:hypothetical protein